MPECGSAGVLELCRGCVGVPQKEFPCATIKELEQRESYEIIQEQLFTPSSLTDFHLVVFRPLDVFLWRRMINNRLQISLNSNIHSAHSRRNFMSYRSSAMTLLKWKCAVFPFTCALVITNASLSTSPPGSKSEMAATSYTFPICNHWGRLIQKSQKRRKWEMFTKLHFTGSPCTSFVLYFNQQY